jgi:hypothetical protein
MALLTLNPVALPKAAGSVNVTAQLTALGANTGVSFYNSGREFLVVSTGTTASTPDTDLFLTIQGATVGSVSAGALAASAVSVMGPWSSQFDTTTGSQLVEVDFSSSAGINVALLQYVGVS